MLFVVLGFGLETKTTIFDAWCWCVWCVSEMQSRKREQSSSSLVSPCNTSPASYSCHTNHVLTSWSLPPVLVIPTVSKLSCLHALLHVSCVVSVSLTRYLNTSAPCGFTQELDRVMRSLTVKPWSSVSFCFLLFVFFGVVYPRVSLWQFISSKQDLIINMYSRKSQFFFHMGCAFIFYAFFHVAAIQMHVWLSAIIFLFWCLWGQLSFTVLWFLLATWFGLGWLH